MSTRSVEPTTCSLHKVDSLIACTSVCSTSFSPMPVWPIILRCAALEPPAAALQRCVRRATRSDMACLSPLAVAAPRTARSRSGTPHKVPQA
eukprot:7307794-Prymnesium_polylepis.1